MEFAFHPHVDRLEAVGEVRARGRGDCQVLVAFGGADAQKRFGGEDERPEVEGGAGRIGNPRGVLAHKVDERSDEGLVFELGYCQPPIGMVEAGRVVRGPKRPDRTVLVTVGLQPLERFLAVVQHRAGGVQGKRAVCFDPEVVPPFVRRPHGVGHVIGEPLSESRGGKHSFALGVARRMRVGPDIPRADKVVGGGHGLHRRQFKIRVTHKITSFSGQ